MSSVVINAAQLTFVSDLRRPSVAVVRLWTHRLVEGGRLCGERSAREKLRTHTDWKRGNKGGRRPTNVILIKQRILPEKNTRTQRDAWRSKSTKPAPEAKSSQGYIAGRAVGANKRAMAPEAVVLCRVSRPLGNLLRKPTHQRARSPKNFRRQSKSVVLIAVFVHN